MTYDEIIKDITSGLSGDAEEDRKYLLEQCDKYKDHEMNKEILRAIGRMMFEIMPEENKDEINDLIKKNIYSWNAVFEEARFNQNNGEYENALEIVASALENMKGMYEDDTVTEYKDFQDLFEFLLYVHYNHPDKDVRIPGDTFPISKMYFLQGSLLIDLKRYEEPQIVLGNALHWNPVSCTNLFEYEETCKCMNDMDGFLETTKEAYACTYTKKDLARCYRNYGYYYYEKEQWKASATCYTLSLIYDDTSAMARSELYGISQETNGEVNGINAEEARKITEQYQIPFGPSKHVLGMAHAYARQNLEKKDYPTARYFLSLLYALTDDEDIKGVIDSLPAQA